MKTAIIVLVGIYLIYSLLQHYFNRKWVLLNTAFGYENYFKIIAKLQNAGVKYKTKTPVDTRGSDNRFKDQTQYDIFVKKDEEHIAHAAVQN